jgi:hypothetical protein
MSHTYPANYFK